MLTQCSGIWRRRCRCRCLMVSSRKSRSKTHDAPHALARAGTSHSTAVPLSLIWAVRQHLRGTPRSYPYGAVNIETTLPPLFLSLPHHNPNIPPAVRSSYNRTCRHGLLQVRPTIPYIPSRHTNPLTGSPSSPASPTPSSPSSRSTSPRSSASTRGPPHVARRTARPAQTASTAQPAPSRPGVTRRACMGGEIGDRVVVAVVEEVRGRWDAWIAGRR
jgi:hypothetical protein